MTSEVHNCDNIEYMKGIPDKFFGLVIADPQYGLGAGTMAYTREIAKPVKQRNGKLMQISKRKSYAQKKWDTTPPPQEYFDELKRISHDQIIWGIDYMNWQGVGPGRIKWDKCVPEGMSFNRYEVAYCSLITNTQTIKLLWSGMQQAKSLSEPETAQGNKKLNEKRIHVTQKPVLLYKRILQLYAHTGEKIFDPNLGSGSSRIAAYDLGYDFWACENDKDIFSDSNKRFELFKSQTKIQF